MTPFERAVLRGSWKSGDRTKDGNFGAHIVDFGGGERAIVKRVPFATDKARGVRKQTLPERGVSVYRLDRDVLRFGLVPETVLFSWKGQRASAQKFVSGKAPSTLVPDLFNKEKPGWKGRMTEFFRLVSLDDMAKGVVLDLIVNNGDRHGKNVLVQDDGKVWFIDNDLTFNPYFRLYKNVFHKYLFNNQFHLKPWLVKRLKAVKKPAMDNALALLSRRERDDAWARLQFLLEHVDELSWKNMEGRDFARWFRQYRAEREGLTFRY